ncbi:MAG: hypothetical protein FD152_1424 [Xanthobacteraceae bacterium]|nr:MAG: hypothetical protein FD152_1424 [Xanthobacteraceae bacterium]
MRAFVIVAAATQFALAVWTGCGAAYSAEVTATGTQTCPITISGTIVVGDAVKLIAATDRIGWTTGGKLNPPDSPEGDLTRVVCLSGPGGSYAEGRRIANFLFDNGFGTRVVAQSECLSACAFIFMAGRNKGDEADGVNRTMHFTSVVGFHAPYYVPPEGSVASANEIRDLNRLWNLVFADMLRFYSWRSFSSYSPSLSMQLLSRIMSAGPSEFVTIATTEDAMRFNVLVEGFNERADASSQAIVQLCRNVLNWSSDRASEPSRVSDAQVRGLPTPMQGRRLTRVVFAGYAEEKCDVAVHPTGYSVCMENEYNGQGLGGCPRYGVFYPAIAAFTPATSLRSLSSRR